MPEAELDPGDDEIDFYAGLRRILHETDPTMIDARAGVKWEWPPILFGQVQAERLFELGNCTISPKQKFFWIEDDGFGSLSSLRMDWWPTETLVARSETSGLRSESSAGWEWEQALGLAYMIGGTDRVSRHLLGTRVSVSGHYEDGSGAVDLYRCALLYRRPVYLDWLYLKLGPALEWRPVEDGSSEYETIPILRVGLDVFFGKYR